MMNGVVFLPESLQRKKKSKNLYRKGFLIFLMSNIFLLLFFYVPYNNLLKLRSENNSLMQTYNLKKEQKLEEHKAAKASIKQKQLLETVNIIEKEKQSLGDNLNIFKNSNHENICIETIGYENRKISIQGKAANYYLIIEFLKFINESKLYIGARLTKVDYIEQDKSFLFQLNIKLKGAV